MIGTLGTSEMLLIVGFVLLLFGPRRLPELARSVGKSVKEFKKGMHEEEQKPIKKKTIKRKKTIKKTKNKTKD